MTIRVVRNDAGNCINFVGTTNPAYWNACLSAEVDSEDPNRINVINNIRTQAVEEPVYEFYKIEYTEFADRDGNPFASAQETAEYITEHAHVVGTTTDSIGSDLTGQSVCFSLDDTSTSILFDIGYSYGVNTIKAVPNADGTIHIVTKLGDRALFSGLEAGLACKADGSVIPGGLNDVANYLNELFTVGPFEAVVISDPFSTMIADVAGVDAGYTLEGTTAIDPAGTEIYANSTSSNYAGLKSVATIDQAGEYFTFDIRGEGQIGFGLVHSDASFAAGKYSGSAAYADPSSFAVGNSAHFGYQFSHWFHPTPNGSWTNYGSNTAYSTRPGWSSWDQKQDWIDGNPVKIRVGLDANAYISIESLQDDGSWVVHARTSYPAPEGAEYHLGIKASNAYARVYSAPKVHLLEPEAPVMQFRYIESPDGVYHYPLFATEEEANYYDEHNSISAGTGTSHTHTYADDPSGTTWYMPDNGRIMSGSTPPQDAAHLIFEGNAVTYTEVTSLTNADLAPPTFSASNITAEEGTPVNIQINPADHSWSTSVSISPANSGLVWDGTSMVQGTLADVGADTVYTITVTRGNSYGSRTGSMTVTATNVAPTQTLATPWTKALDFSGSAERALQLANNAYNNPISMGGFSVTTAAPTTTGHTSNHVDSTPWATAIVFRPDPYQANQHIWNQGEGTGSSDDNIYVRLSSNGGLYFGWGRDGALNECYIGSVFNQRQNGEWIGLYIAFNGNRLSGANATVSNLAQSFDIRLFGETTTYYNGNTGVWTPGSNQSNQFGSNLSTTGGRMDRSVGGDFTVGGRGSNRSFHGKVASCVVTTLKRNVAMPDATEIEKMVTDPLQWLTDYRVGQSYRHPGGSSNYSNFQIGDTQPQEATKIWLMGDGTNDAYAQIRNQVGPANQNGSPLNMISMVSNDIQNVTITGLT